jgi:hypothetical protein
MIILIKLLKQKFPTTSSKVSLHLLSCANRAANRNTDYIAQHQNLLTAVSPTAIHKTARSNKLGRFRDKQKREGWSEIMKNEPVFLGSLEELPGAEALDALLDVARCRRETVFDLLDHFGDKCVLV